MRRTVALVAILMGCGSEEEDHAGTATMVGNIGEVDGLPPLVLTTEHGVSIARSYPPTTEIKVAPDSLSCDATQNADRITFDLGAQQLGTYWVVRGYPAKSSLSAAQARAHICPKRPAGEAQPPCYELVQFGQVVITKLDGAEGGRVEGTYSITIADGKNLTGTFSAYRCN